MKKILSRTLVIAMASFPLLFFQNCGQGFKSNESRVLSSASCVTSDCSKVNFDPNQLSGDCAFNGQTVLNGQDTQAFLTSSGSSCRSETRHCADGVLSGTYQYKTCTVSGPASCRFDGKDVAHGQSVPAYQTSTVPFGGACNLQTRTCTDGALSGSFTYAGCAPAQPASCVFDTQTIAHQGYVYAYSKSSVAYPQSCSSFRETRVCMNGVLSGSMSFASCTETGPASCNFNGQTVPSGSSVTAYAQARVMRPGSCVSQQRPCSDGVLYGSNPSSTCETYDGRSCRDGWGQTVASGGYITLYGTGEHPWGASWYGFPMPTVNGVPICRFRMGFCLDGTLTTNGATGDIRSCADPLQGPVNGVVVVDGKGYPYGIMP